MSAESTPHCCPVCNGHGTVSRPPHTAGDVPTWGASGIETYPCRACEGTGIVWSHSVIQHVRHTPSERGTGEGE